MFRKPLFAILLVSLGELKKAGIIEVGRKRIRIVHLNRLERAACE